MCAGLVETRLPAGLSVPPPHTATAPGTRAPASAPTPALAPSPPRRRRPRPAKPRPPEKKPDEPLDISLVRKAVRSGASGMTQRLLEKLAAAEIAHLPTELSPHELRVVVAELLRARRLVATFAELPDDLLLEVTQGLDEQTMGRILSRQTTTAPDARARPLS